MYTACLFSARELAMLWQDSTPYSICTSLKSSVVVLYKVYWINEEDKYPLTVSKSEQDKGTAWKAHSHQHACPECDNRLLISQEI